MSSALDSYWAARIPIVQALIVAYDAAILALASGAQSYELDTGQTRSKKTAVDLSSLRIARDGLLNELATLDARVNGSGVNVIPGF
jgi:hypothetical protein